jgi:hypothetical protein
LAGPRQFSHRDFKTELKELPSTQGNRVPVDAIDCGYDAVAHSAGAVQENGSVQDAPPFFAARSSKRFEFLSLLIRQSQTRSACNEWHKPFSHRNVLLYSFQQNANLDMNTAELQQSSAELVILALLEGRAKYGYEIAKLVESESGSLLQYQVASIYPMLHRLEAKGVIQGRWIEKPDTRRRKFY